jgi:Pectate lyase superfamily protein
MYRNGLTVLLTLICYFAAAQQVTKDIKKDFGAKGDGKTNDHEAFRRAAKYIMARKGNVKLLIPNGTYIVGKKLDKPMRIKNNFWYDENFDIPDSIDLVRLKNCSNISFIGGSKTILKVQNGVKFGSFDPITGAVPNSQSPQPKVDHPDLKKGFSLTSLPVKYMLLCPPYTIEKNGKKIMVRDTLYNMFSALPQGELYRHMYNIGAYNFQGYYHFNTGSKVDSVYYHFYPTLTFPGNQTVEINPGSLFALNSCSNIVFENLYIDGNSDNYIMGGSKNSGNPAGYEIHANAFLLENVQQLRFTNVHETSFGTLGIQVRNMNSYFKNKSQELSFTNCSFTKNGWGNFYISGGRGISITNCRFDSCGYAAKGLIYTAPCAGMGFEDETGEGVQDVTINNAVSLWNKGAAFNNSYEKDSNFIIRNSRFHSLDYYSFVAAKNTFFYNCSFYNSVNYLNSSSANRGQLVFKNCLFTDKLNDKSPQWKDMKFLFCSDKVASPLLLDSCRFENYYSYFDYVPASLPGMVTVKNCTFNQYHSNMQYGYVYFVGANLINNKYSIPQNKKNAGFINEAKARFPKTVIKTVAAKE